MHSKRWCNLKKVSSGHYVLPPQIPDTNKCCLTINFLQLAFDWDEECLITTDSNGDMYYIDLSNSPPSYQKLGKVGKSTFLAVNPIDNSEIIVGLTNGDIKLCKMMSNTSQFCLLTAHKFPPTCISFYKQYCLTSSQKEVILWCLKSASKMQELKMNVKGAVVKKASFSNMGHILILYHNDTLQAWMLKNLDHDQRIDAKSFDIRNVRDFAFTKNGRAVILAGAQNKIVVLNTCDWTVLKSFKLSDQFAGVKNISVVPLPLDGGANKIIATVSLNCTFNIFDLDAACYLQSPKQYGTIKKIVVSTNGTYLAFVEREGNLNLIVTATLFPEKCLTVKTTVKQLCRPAAHKASDHLRYVKDNIRQELCLGRLLPILKEFGEYPEKYRSMIWGNILKLPGNRCAYSALANQSVPSTIMSELLKNYPLGNKSYQTLLTTILNCLIQWCPILVQSSFLPNLVFPFITVFKKDPMHAFEFVITIMLNYSQKWFEYHPLPPLNVLGVIENILLEVDQLLLNYFCEHRITSTDYAWPLMKTMMSEVLLGTEWLILWDHLISYQKPTLFILCVVAYSICGRDIIMSLSSEKCKQFYTTHSQIRAMDLLKVAKQLDQELSSRTHPSHYFRDEIITLRSKGPYTPFIMYTDYPKVLTESLVDNTESGKGCEKILSQCKLRAMKKAEEERLHRELQNFMDQVHEQRLNQAKKCLSEQASITEWLRETVSCKNETQKKIKIPTEIVEKKKTHEKKNYGICEKLQKDVDKLQSEVQTLLDTLKFEKSRISIV